ncbi:MAG: hypothetical protein JNM25_20075 [Planctomycetes bacterium]|nr:hypothetical protein [Planctomycetota bacterium]
MTDPTASAPTGGGTTAADPVAATLRPLLAEQLRRLRRRYLWHGLAIAIAAPSAAVLLFFALDHSLRLPTPIRLLHATVVVLLGAFAGWRFLRYPLQRRFTDVDLATWVERTFPELHQRLVSALQLHGLADDDLRNQSRPMIDRLLQETASQARALPLDRLFDDTRIRRLALAASGLLLLLLTGAAVSPTTARVFVLRHLGFAAEYPRQTNLIVELPPSGPELQRQDRDGVTELLLPAGADLHVSVFADGVVPKDVFLDVQPDRDAGDGTLPARSIAMTPRPGDRFRHVFRRLAGAFTFHARGGDDESGDRIVVVRTLHPPQVATLRATVTAPAYTGAAPAVQTGGAIEALIGSNVALSLTTTAAVQKATMVFLESGRRLELAPTTLQDDSAQATVYDTKFVVENSDRYQIELFTDNGLRNPNPGTYPIAALQDYAPVGRWLLPDDEALLLLPQALLCVRIDAHDDFGLTAIELGIDHAGARVADHALLPPDPVAGGAPTTTIRTGFYEVRELLGGTQTAGDGLLLGIALVDNRKPDANRTELPRRIVQVVDEPQLAAAIAKAFRVLREEAAQALEVQTDRHARLLDLLAKETGGTAEGSHVLTGIEVGQSRVAAACGRLHTGLMRAFDLHLWNRLETSQHAAEVLEIYRQRSRELQNALALDPGFYRDLQARRRAGTLGAMETTLDPILQMVGIADQLTSEAVPELARLLTEAQVARGPADRQQALTNATVLQQRIQESLQQLLLRLEEWNDYQDLIQETRALRDRQRDVQGRTEEARGK